MAGKWIKAMISRIEFERGIEKTFGNHPMGEREGQLFPIDQTGLFSSSDFCHVSILWIHSF
jgi:hypothetical protein